MSILRDSFQSTGRDTLKSIIGNAPPSRMLNLHALRKMTPMDPGYKSRPFFLHPVLNRSIILKHNMRFGEESRNDKRRLNALKLMFPLDNSDLSSGAQYILTPQSDIESFIGRYFSSSPTNIARDIKLIKHLDDLPTLDPFILLELSRQFGFDIAPCYFSSNHRALSQQREIVEAIAKPILKTISSTPSSTNTHYHWPEDKSYTNKSDLPMNILPQSGSEYWEMSLAHSIFNWKILLFYRWRLVEMTSLTKRLLVAVTKLKAVDTVSQSSPLLEGSRKRVYDAVSAALSEAEMIVEDYDFLHHSVIKTSRLDVFQSLLRQSRVYCTSLGARIGRLEDALAFWSTHASGEAEGADLHALERFLLSFERHIATDLALPAFKPIAPEHGLKNCLVSDGQLNLRLDPRG